MKVPLLESFVARRTSDVLVGVVHRRRRRLRPLQRRPLEVLVLLANVGGQCLPVLGLEVAAPEAATKPLVLAIAMLCNRDSGCQLTIKTLGLLVKCYLD